MDNSCFMGAWIDVEGCLNIRIKHPTLTMEALAKSLFQFVSFKEPGLLEDIEPLTDEETAAEEAVATEISEKSAYPVTTEETEAEEELNDPVITVKLRDGSYMYNDTVTDILKKEGDRGYANLLFMSNRSGYIASELQEDVKAQLTRYEKKRFSDIKDPYTYVSQMSKEALDEFLKCFEVAFNGSATKIAEDAGEASFKDFLSAADIEEIRSAAAHLIEVMHRK